MGPEVQISYKTPDGLREQSVAKLRSLSGALDYRVYDDEPIARHPVGTVLTDFEVVHRTGKILVGLSRPPDVVKRKRWAMVRIKERTEMGVGQPLLLELEPRAPEENLSS